tara:strand:- start:1807 stop:3063 length:1257 start_codon:yes stop_codon:yes gene_type:complete
MIVRILSYIAVAVFALSYLGLAKTSVAEVPAWPEFRGGEGDGRADAADLPIAIDASVVQWETPIHGKAWSSPVVWGGQIWLTTAREDGTKMSVVCVDRATGKVLHDVAVIENETPEFCHPMNSYASPTPVIEAGRLYAHFGSYGTVCIDTADAKVLWRRSDLKCDHFRGPASSPILHDGKLFVAFDGVDVQFVVAFDKKTGDTVWQSKREIDYGTDVGDRMKAYGTAEVIRVGNQEQLVYPSAVATIAYDPQTGKSLWTVYHDGMNASARPIYVDGLVLITNGMGGIVAVRPDGKGNVTKSHVVWTSSKSVAKKSSPIVVDGLVYMITDDGIVTCRELEDGRIVWQKRAGGSYAASPIYASGRIYLFSIEGAITTLKAGREYEMLAETELGDGFMASPAVVGDQMILRSKSALYSIVK